MKPPFLFVYLVLSCYFLSSSSFVHAISMQHFMPMEQESIQESIHTNHYTDSSVDISDKNTTTQNDPSSDCLEKCM